MDHGQQIHLYNIIYKLINEVESLNKINGELRQENKFLKQQLEKHQTPKNSSNSRWSFFLNESLSEKFSESLQIINSSIQNPYF